MRPFSFLGKHDREPPRRPVRLLGRRQVDLLAELARRGFRTVPEPGRRIVEAELLGQGHALAWTDLAAFARRALALSAEDRAGVPDDGMWTVFDRGLIDAAVALQHAGGPALAATLEGTARFHRQVFLTPPWPEIYAADAERRHGFPEAMGEYERLRAAYDALGYETVILPKASVSARADLIAATLPSSRA